MNAIAITTPFDVAPAGFTDWLDTGRALYDQRKDLDWKCADWLATGQDKFPDQMALVLPMLASDPIEQKALTRSARIAATIPASQRDSTLSFAHHSHVADLPLSDRLELLGQARKNNWSARKLRIEAMVFKVDNGHVQVFTDDDWNYHAMTAMASRLNRSPVDVRTDFLQMMLASVCLPKDLKLSFDRWIEDGARFFEKMEIKDVEV